MFYQSWPQKFALASGRRLYVCTSVRPQSLFQPAVHTVRSCRSWNSKWCGQMNIDLVYLTTLFWEYFLLHRVWSHKVTHAIYYKNSDNYQNSSWLLGHIPHLYINILLTLGHTKSIGWILTKTLSTASASKMLNSRNLSKPTWSLQALNQFLHKVNPAPGATWATRPPNGGRVIS